jgi:hypothetical protein
VFIIESRRLYQKIHVYIRLSERGEKQRFLSVAYQQDQQNVSKCPSKYKHKQTNNIPNRNATIFAVVFATTIFGF